MCDTPRPRPSERPRRPPPRMPLEHPSRSADRRSGRQLARRRRAWVPSHFPSANRPARRTPSKRSTAGSFGRRSQTPRHRVNPSRSSEISQRSPRALAAASRGLRSTASGAGIPRAIAPAPPPTTPRRTTFVRAHAALLDGAPIERLAPWLFGVARNVSREHLRARARLVAMADPVDREVPACAADPEALRELLRPDGLVSRSHHARLVPVMLNSAPNLQWPPEGTLIHRSRHRRCRSQKRCDAAQEDVQSERG